MRFLPYLVAVVAGLLVMPSAVRAGWEYRQSLGLPYSPGGELAIIPLLLVFAFIVDQVAAWYFDDHL